MKNLENKVTEIIEQIDTLEKERIKKNNSFKCDRYTKDLYRNLFNTNYKVKRIYHENIDKILKEVFPDKFCGTNEYQEGDVSGIYDLEKPGRSVINKLNTNYSSFCILINDVNKVLRSEGKSEIKLIGENPLEQVNQVKKLVQIIDEKKHRIFSPNSATFQNIMTTLSYTDKSGDEREELVISKLKEIFGNQNVKKIGRLGSFEDTTKGIDCEVTWKNKTYTLQIKPFTDYEIKDGIITILGGSGVKKYYTDWLVFQNSKKGIMIFKNINTKIIDGNYVFPENDLLKTIY